MKKSNERQEIKQRINKREKKNKSTLKKIMLIVSILSVNIFYLFNTAYAIDISSAHVYSIGDCGELLTYQDVVVKSNYVVYTKDGVQYPAYCLDKSKTGADTNGYTVSVQKLINDVGVWRRVINGYPYKSIQELGVANKEEAFLATKQAIYCYVHNNNPDDYRAIGVAGQRTLNAMKKIISDAQNSTQTQISSTIKINKNLEKWKQDNIDKNYLSKTYSVSAGTNIKDYTISLTKENASDIGGIKITDEKNNPKTTFSPNEKFKVLIPIKETSETGKINLKVNAKIKTKPILYGAAPNSLSQDYALTAAAYEDGKGNVQDEYPKNETKIVILKIDEDTKEKLEGVGFQLLDENKNVIYSGLKTDKNGKIEIDNLVPGTYYIREVNTKDGYLKYDDDIKVETKLNQQITITINNKKEDKPKFETTTNEIEVNQEVKKLPLTGM